MTKEAFLRNKISLKQSFTKKSLLLATSILSLPLMAYNTRDSKKIACTDFWTLANVKTYLDNFSGPKRIAITPSFQKIDNVDFKPV